MGTAAAVISAIAAKGIAADQGSRQNQHHQKLETHLFILPQALKNRFVWIDAIRDCSQHIVRIARDSLFQTCRPGQKVQRAVQ